jgi:putative aldouronate transport system permease protein
MIKASVSYKIFSSCNIVFFVILAFIMLFPLYKVFITSIITVKEHVASPLVMWPKEPTLDSYRWIFRTGEILQAARISVFVTLLGTFLSMLFTLLLAYGLSKDFLPWGKLIHRIILATMFIDSGLIPYYMLVRSLGLTNSIFANIFPALISLWNYLVMRSFFKQLPASLEEAALIDGAGWFTLFLRIVLPLSMPVVATFTLFYAVGYWNTWWNAMLFCNDRTLHTLQLLFRRMISANENYHTALAADVSRIYTEGIKMACCIVAMVPILVVYPFLQKYFAKGVLIGAIKG